MALRNRQTGHVRQQRQPQEVRRCPICGVAAVKTHKCKLKCANCGYQECCADACLIEYNDYHTEFMPIAETRHEWKSSRQE